MLGGGAGDVALAAGQGGNRADKIGEALQIALFFQAGAAHHRWETEDFRFCRTVAGDQGGQRFHDILIRAGAAINAVHAGGAEQAVQQAVQMLRLEMAVIGAGMGDGRGDVHVSPGWKRGYR